MQAVEIATESGPVSASVHGAGRSWLLLGHGAGGSRKTPFLMRYAEALAASGRCAVLFNFPYTEKRRKLPDKPAVLEATVAAVAAEARRRGAQRVTLGGKSMGGRIASQAVAQGVPCDALVFLGYPLHPPGRTDTLRDAHLPKITAPMLFLQGTRDAFARWDLVEALALRLPGRMSLVRFDDADHSFAVPKRTGLSAADVEARLVAETVGFLAARGM